MPELTQAQKGALTKEERTIHHEASGSNERVIAIKRALESLADSRILSEARRKMLNKHRHIKHWNPDRTRFTLRCPECHQREDSSCDIDCALDALAKEK